jgi:uncharacterized membrane-anchored protein
MNSLKLLLFAWLTLFSFAAEQTTEKSDSAGSATEDKERPAQDAMPDETSMKEALLKKFNWTRGPAQAELKDIATIQLPEGFMLTGSKGTQELLEMMGNPTSGSELAFLTPTNLSWFVVFEFSDIGYVKDAEKEKLDADAILNSIRKGTEQANKTREKMGVPSMKIVGWEHPPTYNPATQNLEWAIRGESDGEPVINYNTRLLGRKGVMEANLVIDPEKLTATLPTYQSLLSSYAFKQGQTYAEYRSGDKIAKYGLAALITGGAAAVAIKTGLLSGLILFLKKGWKLVVVGIAAIGAGIKKLALGGRRKDFDSGQS